VIAKEVGWGFSGATARRLADAGVAAIDVAGAGGTSWSQVEMYRASTARLANVAATFVDWGIPTAVSIQQCHQAVPAMPLIASGGVHTGIDIAKSIALGAKMAGLAGDFLRAADEGGVEAVVERIETLGDELRIAMFVTGVADLAALAQTPLVMENG
jgi:isopentenyl-diphosphate delta-isomerase